jgi:hypothetical protein
MKTLKQIFNDEFTSTLLVALFIFTVVIVTAYVESH